MKKVLLTATLLCLSLIIAIGVVTIAPIIINGYKMYEQALQQMPIETRIEQIKNAPNYVPLSEISQDYLDMLICSEDKRFYSHCGIDIFATTRAMLHNIKVKSFEQGGSTITQQLAKNLCFSFDKNYERKVAELLVAFKLESQLDKDEILELYCNIAYFGENCYGIKEATTHYYGVLPIDISLSQAQVLTETLKSPNRLNPNVCVNAA